MLKDAQNFFDPCTEKNVDDIEVNLCGLYTVDAFHSDYIKFINLVSTDLKYSYVNHKNQKVVMSVGLPQIDVSSIDGLNVTDSFKKLIKEHQDVFQDFIELLSLCVKNNQSEIKFFPESSKLIFDFRPNPLIFNTPFTHTFLSSSPPDLMNEFLIFTIENDILSVEKFNERSSSVLTTLFDTNHHIKKQSRTSEEILKLELSQELPKKKSRHFKKM